MKNSVIVDALCSQFNWDKRDVDVEFISCIDGQYEFIVIHDHPYDKEFPIKKRVFIKIEDT